MVPGRPTRPHQLLVPGRIGHIFDLVLRAVVATSWQQRDNIITIIIATAVALRLRVFRGGMGSRKTLAISARCVVKQHGRIYKKREGSCRGGVQCGEISRRDQERPHTSMWGPFAGRCPWTICSAFSSCSASFWVYEESMTTRENNTTPPARSS